MSTITVDPTWGKGARWLARLLEHSRVAAREQARRRAHAAAWRARTHPPEPEPQPRPTISAFGASVADLLDCVWFGIYHLDEHALARADWSGEWVDLRVFGELATYDGSALSGLVIGCHDLAIRLAVSSSGPRHLRLTFHRRTREGGVSLRHPTLEAAADGWRSRLPREHRGPASAEPAPSPSNAQPAACSSADEGPAELHASASSGGGQP